MSILGSVFGIDAFNSTLLLSRKSSFKFTISVCSLLFKKLGLIEIFSRKVNLVETVAKNRVLREGLK